MTEVQTSMHFEADPDEVWDVLTDFERIGDWVTVHAGWPHGRPDDLHEGQRFSQCFELQGRRFEVEWTVERLDRPHRLEWSGDGPAGSTASAAYRLHEQDGGTRLEYVTSLDLPGGPVGDVAERVAEPRSDDEAERSLQRLKRLVEG